MTCILGKHSLIIVDVASISELSDNIIVKWPMLQGGEVGCYKKLSYHRLACCDESPQSCERFLLSTLHCVYVWLPQQCSICPSQQPLQCPLTGSTAAGLDCQLGEFFFLIR